MRRDRLYTVNRGNKRHLQPSGNVFKSGGDLLWDRLASHAYGENYGDKGFTLEDYKTSKNWLGLSKQDNPFSKGNIGGTLKGAGNAALGAAAAPVGNLIGGAIDGGLDSSAGNAISDVGGAIGTGLMAVNPFLGAGVTVGSKVLGGITNAAFGMKTDQAALNRANEGIDYYKGYNSNAATYDELQPLQAMASFKNPYKGGWLTGRKARRKNEALRQQFDESKSFAERSIGNNASNIGDSQYNMFAANYAAFGGPLNIIGSDNMGAIGYNFMSDYLDMRDRQALGKNGTVGYLGNIPSEPMTFANGGRIHINPKNKGKLTETAKRTGKSFSELAHSKNPLTRKRAQFALNAKHWNHKHGYGGLLGNDDTLFALGGDMQTNGADWTNNLVTVGKGGSHEENAYGGVPMGIAPDNSPNLVEEGEVIWNDYVLPKRTEVDAETKKAYHLPKNSHLSWADLAKRLEKEGKERPNDPISQGAFKKEMDDLVERHQAFKAKEEAERARKAFEALSPEEQQQVLAQIAAQQQQGGGENGVENGGEVPVDENGNPIDATAQPTQPTEEEMAAQQNGEGIVGAYGGNLNHQYKKGGWKDQLSDAYNIHSIGDWNKLIQNAGFKDFDFSKYSDDKLGYNKMIYELEQTLGEDGYNKLLGQFADDNAAFTHALKNGYSYAFNDDVKPGYDWNPFFEKLKGYDKSKTAGNVAGNYAVDENFPLGDAKTIKDLEGLQSYKDFTNKVADFLERNKGLSWVPSKWKDTFSGDDLQIVNYLDNLMNGVAGSASNADIYMTNPDGTKSFAPNAAQRFRDLRNDQKGGIFHFTPSLMSTTPVTNNYTINGSDVSDYIGTPTGTPVNTYTWVDDDGVRHTNNYYTNDAAPTDEGGKDKGNGDYEPIHKAEWPRYAGLFGPAIGLGLWSAGVGKPDTGQLDAALESTGNAYLADYKPIGNYLTYRPMDIWAQENRNQANARATDRAIVNNSSPVGTKYAGLLANGYNSQLADAQLYRQALEYNDAQRQKVADFNRGTDIQNANAHNQVSQFNADARNRNRQYRASLAADIARQKLAANNEWYNGLYGNIGQLTQGISELGRENATHNMIADMAAAGIFNNMAPNTFIARGYLKDKKGKAKGGKLKKRKGLTF